MCAEAHSEGSRVHLRNCKAMWLESEGIRWNTIKGKAGKQIWELSMLGLSIS